MLSNADRIGKAIDLLRDGLRPKCEETWAGFYGDAWLDVVNQKLHNPQANPTTSDVAFILNCMKATWNDVFGQAFGPAVRSLLFDCATARNNWAHQQPLTSDDTLRDLDSMERLLNEFGDSEHRGAIKSLRRDLMRQIFDLESQSERRKTAAKPTESNPTAGLTPWRDIITPHADVAAGRFNQAEFAADLHEVANGTADTEYQDPTAFFARTYLTEGLHDLLVGATRRLCGDGGDPVIELQTNFGGGKTHSMIALYHLASGLPAASLPGVADALAAGGLSLPDKINRAVLVGQKISPAAPERLEDGVVVHTLWGRLAYQLGGAEGYELVRADDEHGTNPGTALRELFSRYGPAVVLIDEWVAYARQLRDGDEATRLCGGDFDTQFTFAQALTEAASAVQNVVLLVSIPSSDIEVGGTRGRDALEKLKNVVTRKAALWQPASPDESFEIVRRRLFDPIPQANAKIRDGVIRAFSEMYRDQARAFPSGVSEAEYRRRMELSYPIHPELFDRLFGDWSALDKFQRTRGVLRLMAIAISQLWQRGDQSLLIMPGNLPMDSAALVSEMKKYLEEGWDPVIKSDVDGENALPLRIDKDNKHFGRISACRRAARTVFMGSAPYVDESKGVDIKRVVLGSAQPGEPTGQFADALKRLSDEATHLYVDGAQYRFSLQPNATRLAADRSASNYTDRDADDEIRGRLAAQNERDRGVFAFVQAFAAGPGDVPDEDDGVRLVILTPEVTHSNNDPNSPAVGLASSILNQRDAGPRLNRNLLVFVAAAANRLAELRAASRLYLAWQSILAESVTLDLTEANKKLAETQIASVHQKVDALIAETFTLVLTPSQEPGTAEITWTTTKAGTSGAIGARVSKKLATEEKLIATYGGVRVKMDIDRYGLWSDRGDLGVGDLWTTYARYPHMPRLASFSVLAKAVSDGTSSMNWSAETFGYAEAHDGTSWVGLHTGEQVTATRSGLLIEPSSVPKPEPAAGDDGDGGDGDARSRGSAVPDGTGSGTPGGDATGSSTVASVAGAAGTGGFTGPERGANVPAGSGAATSDTPSSAGPAKTQFYAQFDLDSVRAIKQLGEILEHVTKRLGPNVELHLEVRADNPEGFDDATQRIVSENATNLNANSHEFE